MAVLAEDRFPRGLVSTRESETLFLTILVTKGNLIFELIRQRRRQRQLGYGQLDETIVHSHSRNGK